MFLLKLVLITVLFVQVTILRKLISQIISILFFEKRYSTKSKQEFFNLDFT